jgi:hypothetical protein
MSDWSIVTEDFLYSLKEQEQFLHNINMEIGSDDIDFMIEQYLGENQSYVKLDDMIMKLLLKIKEMIHSIIRWFKQKYKQFSAYIRRQQRSGGRSFKINRSSLKEARTKIDLVSSTINLKKAYDTVSVELSKAEFAISLAIAKFNSSSSNNIDNVSSKINSAKKKIDNVIKEIKVEKDMVYKVSNADNLIRAMDALDIIISDNHEQIIAGQIENMRTQYSTLRAIANRNTRKVDNNLYKTSLALSSFLSNLFVANSQLLTISTSILSEAENVLKVFSE